MISKKNDNDLFNQTFWNSFVENTWEKKSVVLKNTRLPLFEIDAKIIFQWLVQYSDICRKNKKAVGLKFYIDGESQYEHEVLQALPLKSDKSLLGYHYRISQLFSDYCLVCDELIQVSGSKWNLLSDFMSGLYQRVGIPNRQTEIGLYLGNYKKTPFGVHVDGCGVFSIPVVGEKKFRIWKPSYVKKNPDLEMAFEYQRHLKQSTVLTAKPQDLTYWPSSAWHIAESSGSFSATWSLGVWVDQPYSEVITEILKPLIFNKIKKHSNEKFVFADNRPHRGGEVKKLPTLVKNSVEQLGSISKAELYDLFMKDWLHLESKNGFTRPARPHLQQKLKRSDLIRLDKKNSLLWTQLTAGSLCVASHGELFMLSKSNLSLLKTINSGNSFEVASVLRSGKSNSSTRKVLERLYQLGRFIKIS